MASTEHQAGNIPLEGAKTTYDKLTTDRDPYTQRAEKCATYTIPMLFPKESDDGGTNYSTPYNSVGARGLNNLASKLLLSLLILFYILFYLLLRYYSISFYLFFLYYFL